MPIIKIKFKLVFVCIVILYSSHNLNASNDSIKKKSIYLNLTKCLVDDIIGSGNSYIVAGYSHLYNKFRVDISAGLIVYHRKSNDLLDIKVDRMSGIYTSFEIDKLFAKKFYYGIQFNYRYTQSTNDIFSEFSKVTVFRNAASTILKFGILIEGKKNFGVDIGAGIGAKYITSFNTNSNSYQFKEFPSGKNYNSGSGVYPAILLIEIKLFKKI